MKINKFGKLFVTVLCVSILFCSCALGGSESTNPNSVKLNSNSPTKVTIWHYYNGTQQEAFNTLVEKFNNTVGKEKGIIVQGFSQGNVTDLEASVLDSVNQKVGADKMPSIFAAYADTAYAVDKLSYVVDLAPYLTKDERDEFIDSYFQEGCFTDDNSVKIFPVAKSTEIFMLNKTFWDKFANETGAKVEELATIEGLVNTAEKFYNWTDSLTNTPNDGVALFGRDAMANYLLIGAKQLGVELFAVNKGVATLNFDKAIVKKLWDNYYIPYINGYFSSSGRFRSDDIKTGDIISCVGSSSGATFFPDQVILSDTESYPIDIQVLECPKFANAENFAVQQGAGMVVTKTSDKEIYASVEFLKWFTLPENNIKFSIDSGYLPVTKKANNIETIKTAIGEQSPKTLSIISTSIDTVNKNTLYTTKAFENGTKARNVLEFSMSDIAKADREIVLENMAGGESRENAVAGFVTDEYFDAWYQKTLAELQAVVK